MTVKKAKAKKLRKVLPPVKITEKMMLEEQFAYIDLCFAVFADEVKRTNSDHIDLKELSNRTTLSVSTLSRLAAHQCTLNVRAGTLRKLAAVAGIGIEYNPGQDKCIIVVTR